MCHICGQITVHEDSTISTETYTVTTTKPVFGLSQIVTQLTTQWGSQEGSTRSWKGATSFTYSIPTTAPEAGSTEASGFVPMSATKTAAAREAFELWDDVIAVSLNESTSATANMTFAYSTKTLNGGTYARTYTSYDGTTDLKLTAARIWLAAGWSSHDTDADLVYGGYGRLTYVHEVGHALGLSHPGTYNAGSGSITYTEQAEYAQDTRRFTVLSYFQATADGSGVDHVGSDGKTAYAAGPLLHDIAAAQAKYGADMTTRTGNTVYGFGANAGRAVFDFTQNKNPIIAIWDAGGTDTLNASGFSTNQRITLVAGAFSDIGYLTKNVAIAFGATIENAIGGSGSDLIEGNAARNTLTGGGGNDELYGGDGNDVLVGGAGADRLDGGNGGDQASYASAAAGVSVNRVTNAHTGEAYGDVFVGVEQFRLSNYDDVFLGLSAAETVYAGGGLDLVDGGGGNDRLYGGSGADTVKGGAGGDFIVGESGGDFLYGGTEKDTFYFRAGSGHDWIADFQDGVDVLRLAIGGVLDMTDVKIASHTAGAVVTWGDSNSSILLAGIAPSQLSASDFLFG